MAAAVKHLTPVTLELGGKCPAIVDSTVNLQARHCCLGFDFKYKIVPKNKSVRTDLELN